MTRLATALLLASTALAGTASAQTMVALTADNQLVRIDGESRRASAPVRVSGAEGRLLGIDQRPADGRLYGLTDAGQIVTLDPMTGRATAVSRLSERLDAGGRAVVDFNPAADRLRVMGLSGQNLRVNVENGQAVVDGTLKYAPGEWSGTSPRVTAGAYTNSMAGTTSTMLLTLDTTAGLLNLQNPPNDGVQAPRGRVSMPLPAGTAFDILSTGPGNNRGFLIAGGALHTIGLEDGRVETLGAVAGLPTGSEVIDVAAMR
ncbi:DUF4394 domain-containing protein [Sabulicella glaciei]|uniref:DUF4394 domain-containing protein n=1 Tax=Sabulicella glaciei TaxID=2984948 RepID=A0ABT3NYD4_9PROT|nr:DUF4394 domain-containing protein [Roseococcus sp. MDT2-1-1]MCW8087183.1 DUF4394 domain-containing protein [Roseococcus sp. MDT2-1-1]